MQTLELIEEKNLINDLRSYKDPADGSLTDPILPIQKDDTIAPFDPFEERMQDYNEAWKWLTSHVIEYDWSYRKKICTKCSLETQEKLKCFKADNFKIIDGVKIQKTYCSKLKRARANKFRNHIKHVFAMSPFLKTT